MNENSDNWCEDFLQRSCCCVYFHGYWQSEKYFINHEKVIRKDFVFRSKLNSVNLKTAQLIAEKPSVGLHVRRGDYLSNPKNFSLHGVCTYEYYQKAINYILQISPHSRFFVFTDDPQWVQKTFLPHYPEMIIVNGNTGSNSYIDMQLMSLCSHNIIANSTFSWWAAWLNSNPRKVVIAPRQWLADGRNTVDLVPAAWIRL